MPCHETSADLFKAAAPTAGGLKAPRHDCNVGCLQEKEDEPQGFGYRFVRERSPVRIRPGPPHGPVAQWIEHFSDPAPAFVLFFLCVPAGLFAVPTAAARLERDDGGVIAAAAVGTAAGGITQSSRSGGEPRTFGYPFERRSDRRHCVRPSRLRHAQIKQPSWRLLVTRA